MEIGRPTTASLGELILEQLADAVIYSDRDGIIRRWNRAAAETFGYAPDEAIGTRLDLIIPERLRAAHWRGFEAAMASGVTRLKGRPTLTRGEHKQGRKLYVEMSFALVVDEAGAVQGSVAMARDVSERITREKAAAGEAGNKPGSADQVVSAAAAARASAADINSLQPSRD